MDWQTEDQTNWPLSHVYTAVHVTVPQYKQELNRFSKEVVAGLNSLPAHNGPVSTAGSEAGGHVGSRDGSIIDKPLTVESDQVCCGSGEGSSPGGQPISVFLHAWLCKARCDHCTMTSWLWHARSTCSCHALQCFGYLCT